MCIGREIFVYSLIESKFGKTEIIKYLEVHPICQILFSSNKACCYIIPENNNSFCLSLTHFT